MSEFQEFPKITRFLEQDVVVTEKIDGTNGLIWVSEDGSTLRAGSRTRWITPEDDNYGFARWVQENTEGLLRLGPGYHYGEWWGRGIQRNYGMDKKVFSLFNSHRWWHHAERPECCDVVPIIYEGPMTESLWEALQITEQPSQAASKYGVEFNNIEGYMMYFTKAKLYFKVPFEKGAKG